MHQEALQSSFDFLEKTIAENRGPKVPILSLDAFPPLKAKTPGQSWSPQMTLSQSLFIRSAVSASTHLIPDPTVAPRLPRRSPRRHTQSSSTEKAQVPAPAVSRQGGELKSPLPGFAGLGAPGSSPARWFRGRGRSKRLQRSGGGLFCL